MPTTTTPFQKKFAPGNKKGGEAPKGAIQPLAAQHQQALPPIDARARLRAITEARPPSGASPRHSPGRTHPALAQPQNRVSRHLELAGVLPAYILASVKRAPRRPVFLPVDRCPRAARERIAFIRARAPHSLRLPKVPSRKAPFGERDGRHVTIRGTNVKVCRHMGDACTGFFSGTKVSAFQKPQIRTLCPVTASVTPKRSKR